MSKTLHQFGRVLFDELEQVAVRRGGFASLAWVNGKLAEAQRGARELRDEAADPNIDLPSLRKSADERARQARDALGVAAQTAEAVEQLGQIISDMVKTAQEVQKRIKPPDVGQEHPGTAKLLTDLINALYDRFRRPRIVSGWEERVQEVESRVSQHAESCLKAREALDVQAIRDQNERVLREAKFKRICRVAWGLKDLNDLSSEDRVVAEEAREAFLKVSRENGNSQDVNQQVTRGAVVLRSDDLASALDIAIAEFAKVIAAFKTVAEVKKGPVVELGGLVAAQSAGLRFEIYGLVEDRARKAAMRMGTVGLAFSGGGIRSATFNLGFLQGAAALGILKQFDYLSTVSGGGYIGAWFASWVLREGGGPADGEPPPDVSERTSRALRNVQFQLSSSRARQASALRRWVTSATIRDGREEPGSSPPLGRTVEEEPEAVYHLRAHSNYLAPRIGLLSIDTWTMASVYLRNLFVNQFILLPMMLAMIAVPRLLLLLFTHKTSTSMINIARDWLVRRDGWPQLAVLLVAIVAVITLPELVDSLARRIGRRFDPWKAGTVTLVLLALGMTAVVNEIFRSISWLIPPTSPGTAPTLIRWMVANPWATGLAVLVPVALVAAIGYKRVARLAQWAGDESHARASGWAILSVLALGIAALAGWLLKAASQVPDLLFWWFTGDAALFVATLLAACMGFYWTYLTVAEIRLNRGSAPVSAADRISRFDVTKPILFWKIVMPLTVVSFGVSLLFARPGKHYFVCPLPVFGDWFVPAKWGAMTYMPAVCFGMLVGFMRAVLSVQMNLTERYRNWGAFEWEGRAFGILIGVDLGRGTGGGVVVAERGGGGPPEWSGGAHDGVRSLARDDRDGCGLGD